MATGHLAAKLAKSGNNRMKCLVIEMTSGLILLIHAVQYNVLFLRLFFAPLRLSGLWPLREIHAFIPVSLFVAYGDIQRKYERAIISTISSSFSLHLLPGKHRLAGLVMAATGIMLFIMTKSVS
jgi:hypothetical protein